MTRPRRRGAVCIVGAGICGLVAARFLQGSGREVVVLDKSRGVGGRMATRRLGAAVVDHGVQFVTTHDARFGRLLKDWETDGVAREWARGLSFPLGRNGSGSIAYRGRDGMTSIPKRIAERLDVRLSAGVKSIDHDEHGYLVHTVTGDLPGPEILVLTAPVPQSLALLEAGDVHIDREDREILRSIRYDPCLTVLALLDGPSAIPSPGALRLDGAPVAFLGDNHQKGISPEEFSVTIHAGPEYSRAHIDDDEKKVAAELIAAVRDQLRANVVSFMVHRWRYGVPVLRHPEPFFRLKGEAIYLAGDAFGGPNVEGAVLSGLAVADHIRQGA